MKSCFEGKFRVTSPYGMRSSGMHNGIDLVGINDTTVYAPCDGVIGASTIILDKSNKTWEWGNYVRLDTADGAFSVYLCHLSSRAVSKGQKVKKGDKIGVMGYTGKTDPIGVGGTHTHFEVRKYGTSEKVDPAEFIGIPNKVGTYEAVRDDDEAQEIAGYISILNKAGIIDNIELWKRKAAQDKDIYHLLRKAAGKL